MQAVFRLILEGLAMFAGSWAAGCVPLYVRMDQAKFSILALFGAGLLVGAALGVILPEGVETLSRSLLKKQDPEWIESANTIISWSLVGGFVTMFIIDNLFPSHHHSHDLHEGTPPATSHPDNDSAACLDDIPMASIDTNPAQHTAGSEFTLSGSHRRHSQADSHSFEVGAPLPSSTSHGDAWAPESSRQKTWRRIVGKLGGALSPRRLPSTLLGILVHSCADGLALGAAVAASAAQSDSHSSSLEIIVFMALLLHKAPAAFGLITTLKQQGYAPYKLGVWLTIFAASAPLAALFTFGCFLLAGPSATHPAHGEGAVQPWAGIVMLYSAGTFLYVAMAHTLAEAISGAKRLRARASASIPGSKPTVAGLSLVDIAVLLLGVVLPPLVSKDHDE
ncbi:hypothetical protein LPJ61_005956 [Coemansia biformis]|uniref:Zinc/iron permease n=1 Tax=Coemansia biformis TaxID=1286918 RepID=A0A9W8CQ96_9FUNG|nr:hypothetical protein LPJ61_005956 [Coemansia biformis]